MVRRWKVISAVLAFALCITSYFLWANSGKSSYRVWVAAFDILPGQAITESMLKYVDLEQPVAALKKDAILGKIATVLLPKNSVIAAGVEAQQIITGSLVHIPVSVGTAGMITPGSTVQLIAVENTPLGESSPELSFFGPANVIAVIDNGGKVHKQGPAESLPVVLVVEVPADIVPAILEKIKTSTIYPVLGGQFDANSPHE